MAGAVTSKVLLREQNLSVVIYGLEPGGTEIQLLEILARLRGRGWQPTVFTLGRAGTLKGDYIKKGIHVVEPPEFGFLTLVSPVAARVVSLISGSFVVAIATRLTRRSLVIGILPAGSIVVALLSFMGRQSHYIVMRRNRNHYQDRHRVFGYVERWFNRRGGTAIGNSRRVAMDLLAEGVNATRIAVIPNGVDTERMASGVRNLARAEYGLADDEVAVLCVANLIGYKGHADLIAGIARARFPGRWRLLLAGRDDGIASDIAKQAQQLGIADRLLILGSVRDMPSLLAAADIGALVSHEEGFSNAVLEGMAAALPMLVSDVGGNAEAIGDGEAGIVVPPREPDKIAEALTRLAGDGALRNRLGNAGQKLARERYSFDVCVDAFESVCRSVSAGQAIPPNLQAERLVR